MTGYVHVSVELHPLYAYYVLSKTGYMRIKQLDTTHYAEGCTVRGAQGISLMQMCA